MRTTVLILAAVLGCRSAEEGPQPATVVGEDPEIAAAQAAPEDRADPGAAGAAGLEAEAIRDTGAAPPEPEAPTPWLAGIDFEDRLWYVDLPGRLDEVSGLAFTPDGRLFAHDDERARIHEIDPATGAVGKSFDLGARVARGDFEGIAVVGTRFFLVESIGLLYEFREGADGAELEYRRTDTGLGSDCEIEGLDYDALDNALVFACKTATPERGAIVLHRLSLDPSVGRLPDLLIPRAAVAAAGADRGLAPSAVVFSPNGTILVLSGRNDAIIEVDRSGDVLAAVALRGGRHPQSEGIAVGPDGVLYVTDEKNGKEPRITAYGPLRPPGA